MVLHLRERERLTFVLQCAMCGLQHGLVEVLSKSLRCKPLPGPIPSILHRIGFFFVWGSNGVLEALELPVWLSLREFGLFRVGVQRWRIAGRVGVHGGFECVIMGELSGFV